MSGRVFGFYDLSACGYYRITLPFDALTAHGWDTQTSYGWNEQAREWPLIIGQRVSRTDALPIWRRLTAGHKLVYETDDDCFNIDPTNLRARAEHTPSLLDAAEMAMGISHMVTVSTPTLAETIKSINANVSVLPNLIDARLLDLERPRRDTPTIGWAGGDSHLRDMAMFAPHLKRFLRRHPGWEFHNIGTDFRTFMKVAGRATGWLAIWDYYAAIDFDIGVAPLADIPFNKSKSHIKALEYAALGIPVVASAEPPYSEFVLDGVTGFLVRSEHEWGRRLHELASSADLRAQMGAKAKEHAAEWTIQRGWQRWADAYGSLL
jgi:glycosyltransferase involved in cell wall biosynthesis